MPIGCNRLQWVAVFRQPEMGTSFFPVRESLSMNSSRRAGWYYRWWGEWFGPETMKQLVKSTSHLPRTVVLAVDLDDRNYFRGRSGQKNLFGIE